MRWQNGTEPVLHLLRHFPCNVSQHLMYLYLEQENNVEWSEEMTFSTIVVCKWPLPAWLQIRYSDWPKFRCRERGSCSGRNVSSIEITWMVRLLDI